MRFMHWSWHDLQCTPDYVVDAIIAKMKGDVERQRHEQAVGRKKRR
jgi:hypothetical protein